MFVLDARDFGPEVFTRSDADRVQSILETADSKGLSNLTIIEEFSGPTNLVSYFKKLLQEFESKAEVHKVNVIDEHRLSFEVETCLEVNMIASYRGKSEVVASVKKIIGGSETPKEEFEAAIGSGLLTAIRPEPDLIVFFGGRRRVGEVGVWIGAYSELAFLDKLWQSFTADDLTDLLADFGLRERRFGAV